MIHNDIVRWLVMILLLAVTGCLTIKPRIEGSHFWACHRLCKGNSGVASMSSIMKLNYTGITVISEECSCKNKRAFKITDSKQN